MPDAAIVSVLSSDLHDCGWALHHFGPTSWTVVVVGAAASCPSIDKMVVIAGIENPVKFSFKTSL
jgi:hypothetical protein